MIKRAMNEWMIEVCHEKGWKLVKFHESGVK